jgi:hypothetical protein
MGLEFAMVLTCETPFSGDIKESMPILVNGYLCRLRWGELNEPFMPNLALPSSLSRHNPCFCSIAPSPRTPALPAATG